MILLAKRCEKPAFPPSRGVTTAQKIGLRYERKVFKQLIKQFGPGMVEHNPWYNYEDDETGFHACCPDIIIWRKVPIILEVKYTYTPEAMEKIANVYVPVVFLATAGISNIEAGVIVKHLSMFNQNIPSSIIQWLGKGPIEIPRGG